MKPILNLASGPAIFLAVYLLPYDGIEVGGRVTMGIFAWMVLWWVTQPVPWAITSILPLLLFPVFNVMNINGAVAMYGQRIFFWIWGTILLGYAMDRHGLAKRFALWFMSLRWIHGSTYRVSFGFMLVTGVVSMVVSSAATVAMMIPVGVSLTAFVRSLQPDNTGKSNFGAFMALGALYGALAGGCATIAGIPHNALSVTLLEQFAGRSLGWFEWMAVGVPVFVVTLLAFYFVLLIFLPPEFKELPGGAQFLNEERRKLGPMSSGEWATSFVFVAMVVLFILPTLLGLTLGPANAVSVWSRQALNLYVVPPIILVLLFVTPVDLKKGQFVLTWKEVAANTPWDIMILTTAAAGIIDVLVDFGFVALVGGVVSNLGLGVVTLPLVASVVVAVSTNFISGVAATTFFDPIFIPAAQSIGWNPASMAILIPNVALGVIFPWAGAATGTAFATGQIELGLMVRVGSVATVVFAFLVAAVHLLMAPIV